MRPRRPRGVHRPLERERVEKRDGMLTAVVGQVAVVAVDHRDARAHEAGDGEHRHAGAERKGGVGVAQFVEVAQLLDASGCLCRLPMPAAEAAEVDPLPRVFGNRISLSECGRRSSASRAFACSGTARLLSRVFVCLSRPFAYARRT